MMGEPQVKMEDRSHHSNSDPKEKLTSTHDFESSLEDEINTIPEGKVPSVPLSFIPKDTGWSWMVMLGCCLVHVFIIGGAIKSFGILYVEFMERFQSGAEKASWIIVFAQGLLLLFSPLGNYVALQLSYRFVVFSGGILISLGFIFSMFANSIEYLYFSYGLCVGIGSAFSWSPSIAAMGQYFSNRRALANGIAVGGAGIGSLFLPPLMRYVLDNYGYKGALLILAGLMLHVSFSAFLLRPTQFYANKNTQKSLIYRPVTNVKHMCKSEEARIEKANEGIGEKKSCHGNYLCSFFCPGFGSSNATASSLFRWELLKSPLFVLFGVSAFLFFSGFPSLFIIIPAHAQQVGYSKRDAAFLVSIMGIADLIGRVGTGWFADYKIIRTSRIIVVSQLITCLATILSPLVDNYIFLCVTCWINGMFTGSFMAVIPGLLAEALGVAQLASSMGLIGLFMGCGVFVAPPSVGSLRDTTGSWNASFYFTATMLLLSSISMMFETLFAKKFKHHSQTV